MAGNGGRLYRIQTFRLRWSNWLPGSEMPNRSEVDRWYLSVDSITPINSDMLMIWETTFWSQPPGTSSKVPALELGHREYGLVIAVAANCVDRDSCSEQS